MPESAGKLVLDVIVRDCTKARNGTNCPYGYGDGAASRKVIPKIDRKLVHRVSDGTEVRKLEERVKSLEVELLRLSTTIKQGKKLSTSDVERIEALLRSKAG
jgi:hypothetical protein